MAKVKRINLFFVFSVFFLYLFTVNTRAAPLPSRLWIDSPTSGTVYTKQDVNVSGWALCGSGVKSVDISINDVTVGQANIGLTRTDVNQVYPGYVNGDKSGYSYVLKNSMLKAGNNKISVTLQGNNGEVLTYNTNVTADKQKPRLWVDNPYDGQAVEKQDIQLSGWALNANGIKEVDVLINDKVNGQATLGRERADVDAVYPGYTNGKNSGFAYTIKNSSLAGGKNTVTVKAIGVDGDTQSQIINVQKNVPLPKMYVDYPYDQQTINNTNINVSGWSVNYSGVQTVKIYLDGNYMADATVGMKRTDVGDIFPQYLNSDSSGFRYTMDINKVSTGKHKITVESIGVDGSKQSRDVNVTVTKPEFKVCLDDPYSNQTIEDSDMVVSGWALNASGVKSAKVSLDGAYVGDAALGIARPDVNSAFPGYPGGANSGFRYVLLNDQVGKGTHQLSIEVQGNDGTKSVIQRQFQKKYLPNLLWVDTPNDSYVSNNSNINVTGWSLNRKGIKEVNIIVDGIINGRANLGGSRADVAGVYPKYADAASSGFSYVIDVDKIAPGSHRLIVESVGNDGSGAYSASSFNVQKKSIKMYIDSPAPSFTIKSNSVAVNGWALSDSTISSIKISVDGKYNGNATTGIPRPDVNDAFPGYKVGNYGGYAYTLDTSSLPIGKHTVTVQVNAADGTSYSASVSVQMFGVVNYVNYSNNLDYYANRELAKGGNVNMDGTPVTKDELSYYMNPANFLSDPNYKYIFLKLTYTEGITAEDLNKVLVGKGILEGKGSVFLNAGRVNNINPIYLVAHALLETGNGTSKLSNGILVTQIHSKFGDSTSSLVDVTDKVAYNMFGIGAYDSNANLWGSEKAYNMGWFTVDDAIMGGAAWIGDGYIDSPKQLQYTLYKMKWDLDMNNGSMHQYATDVAWAIKQTTRIRQLIDQMSNPVLYFEVPVFAN